jgi:Protein of unknown function (DUF2599)
VTPMRGRRRRIALSGRRILVVPAIVAVLFAAVITSTHDDRGAAVSALPGATGQPALTGPTGGGSGGGMGGPPFPLQPPDMPSPPGGYNSGAYPAPDQGNGISIYNSDAPQSPGSRSGNQQAPNYPQQLQPANGSQPPDYDSPLQTQPAPRASTATQQPGELPAEAPSQSQEHQLPTQSDQPPNQQTAPDQSGQRDESNTHCQVQTLVTSSAWFSHSSIRLVSNEIPTGPYYFPLDPPYPPSPIPSCGCDQEAAKQTPDTSPQEKEDILEHVRDQACGNDWINSVSVEPAKPGAEGGLASLHVHINGVARIMGFSTINPTIPFVDKAQDLGILQGFAGAEIKDAWKQVVCQSRFASAGPPGSNPVDASKDMNTDGMYQQFVCHWLFASKKPGIPGGRTINVWDWQDGMGKPSWNLEPSRPVVGEIGTIENNCNPL